MDMTISISEDVALKLKRRATESGRDVAAVASDLLEQAVTQPTLEELLAISQAEFASTGMTADEIMDFGRELLEKVRTEKAPRA